MQISRRGFVRNVGGAGVVTFGSVALSARGSEAAAGWLARGAVAPDVPSTLIRLESNENPVGPAPEVLEALRDAFSEANRYPGRAMRPLQDDIARMHGVQADRIALGCGSGEILRMAVDAFTSATRGLVAGLPTFESPAGRARQLGRPVVEVPVDRELRLDLDVMAASARDAGLVFFCNPNNPTGTLHTGKAMRDFIAGALKASPDVMVLVDEAYHDYVDDPAYESMVPLALENPRVIVSRTFSKAFGLAGVRLGYAIGAPESVRALTPWRLGNSVSVLAAAAGRAAVAARRSLEAERARNRAALDFTARAFTDMGFRVTPAQTNFVFADIRRSARAFAEACRGRGVAIGRPFPPLDTWTRVSIGTMDEMRKAVEVFRQVLAPSSARVGV